MIRKKEEIFVSKVNTLLVDGNSVLKESFHGKGVTLGNDSKDIGTLYKFITKIRKVIHEYSIEKCIVAWDGENGGKRRYKLYTPYKAKRKHKSWYNKFELTEAQIAHIEKDKGFLLYQKIRIQNYIENLFIRQIEFPEVEADDIIAHYCKIAHQEEDIIIYTNDKDLCQLLQYNVRMYMRLDKKGVLNEGTLLNKDNYMRVFPFHYENIVIAKTLCGDISDTIEGIYGLSDKDGAKTLMKLFPELKDKKVEYEDIINKSQQLVTQNIIYEKIINSKKSLDINYIIINLAEPLLNDDEKEEIEIIKDAPLSDEGRNSTNLKKLMDEDGFLNNYYGGFTDYVKSFYTIIIREKKMFEQSKE